MFFAVHGFDHIFASEDRRAGCVLPYRGRERRGGGRRYAGILPLLQRQACGGTDPEAGGRDRDRKSGVVLPQPIRRKALPSPAAASSEHRNACCGGPFCITPRLDPFLCSQFLSSANFCLPCPHHLVLHLYRWIQNYPTGPTRNLITPDRCRTDFACASG